MHILPRHDPNTNVTLRSFLIHIYAQHFRACDTTMAELKFQNALNSVLGNLATVRLEMHKYVRNPDFDSLGQIEEIAFLANDVLDRKIYHIDTEPVAKYNEPVCEVPEPYISVVDQPEDVPAMADSMIQETLLPRSDDHSPTVYIDCEGENLGRHGTLTHINAYLPQQNEAFIIDVDRLGDQALQTAGKKHHRSFRSILQDPSIKKAIFDCRSDSDALFAHHRITLDGIVDIQLLENATCKTKRSAQKLASLAACLGRLNLPRSARARVLQIKEQGKAAFSKTQQSGKNPFHERPLSKLLIEYSVGDLVLLPALYRYLTARPGWTAQWLAREQHATAARLEMSRAEDFRLRVKAEGISMSDAPEEWKGIDRVEDVERAARAARELGNK